MANYVHGVATTVDEARLANSGVAPKPQQTAIPKEEQVVIEDDITTSDSDDLDDMFDGEAELDNISLDTEPAKQPVTAGAVSSSVDFDDEDMSFSVGDEEDFFGDE